VLAAPRRAGSEAAVLRLDKVAAILSRVAVRRLRDSSEGKRYVYQKTCKAVETRRASIETLNPRPRRR
jgi:hypothetical protein